MHKNYLFLMAHSFMDFVQDHKVLMKRCCSLR